MNISEVKTPEDVINYCDQGLSACMICPIGKKCAEIFLKLSEEEVDLTNFYYTKLELIVVYNRRQKLEKLLA